MKMVSRSTLSIVITAVMCLLPAAFVLVSLPAVADAGSDAVLAGISAAGSAGLLGTVGVYIGYAATTVGAASIILQGIALVTGVTPSKRDDEFVNEGFRLIAKVQGWLDRLALNPTSDKARRR